MTNYALFRFLRNDVLVPRNDCYGLISILFFFLLNRPVEFGQVFSKDIRQTKRDLIVILLTNLIFEVRRILLIEPHTDRRKRVLVTKLGVETLPDADAEISTDTKVAFVVGVGVLYK